MKDSTYEKYKTVIDEWFVNGFNGTQAYLKYYPNVSEDTAAVRFAELVRISKIDTYVQSKHNDATETLKTSHEALLKELENWAYADITETILLSPDQIKELPIEVRRLITKYKTTTKSFGESSITETVVELHFVSKERAMEMIHKHTGFYGEHNYQKNSNLAELSPEQRRAKIKSYQEKISRTLNK